MTLAFYHVILSIGASVPLLLLLAKSLVFLLNWRELVKWLLIIVFGAKVPTLIYRGVWKWPWFLPPAHSLLSLGLWRSWCWRFFNIIFLVIHIILSIFYFKLLLFLKLIKFLIQFFFLLIIFLLPVSSVTPTFHQSCDDRLIAQYFLIELFIKFLSILLLHEWRLLYEFFNLFFFTLVGSHDLLHNHV